MPDRPGARGLLARAAGRPGRQARRLAERPALHRRLHADHPLAEDRGGHPGVDAARLAGRRSRPRCGSHRSSGSPTTAATPWCSPSPTRRALTCGHGPSPSDPVARRRSWSSSSLWPWRWTRPAVRMIAALAACLVLPGLGWARRLRLTRPRRHARLDGGAEPVASTAVVATGHGRDAVRGRRSAAWRCSAGIAVLGFMPGQIPGCARRVGGPRSARPRAETAAGDRRRG